MDTFYINSDKIQDKSITREKLQSGVIPTKVSQLENDSGYLSSLNITQDQYDIDYYSNLTQAVPLEYVDTVDNTTVRYLKDSHKVLRYKITDGIVQFTATIKNGSDTISGILDPVSNTIRNFDNLTPLKDNSGNNLKLSSFFTICMLRTDGFPIYVDENNLTGKNLYYNIFHSEIASWTAKYYYNYLGIECKKDSTITADNLYISCVQATTKISLKGIKSDTLEEIEPINIQPIEYTYDHVPVYAYKGIDYVATNSSYEQVYYYNGNNVDSSFYDYEIPEVENVTINGTTYNYGWDCSKYIGIISDENFTTENSANFHFFRKKKVEAVNAIETNTSTLETLQNTVTTAQDDATAAKKVTDTFTGKSIDESLNTISTSVDTLKSDIELLDKKSYYIGLFSLLEKTSTNKLGFKQSYYYPNNFEELIYSEELQTIYNITNIDTINYQNTTFYLYKIIAPDGVDMSKQTIRLQYSENDSTMQLIFSSNKEFTCNDVVNSIEQNNEITDTDICFSQTKVSETAASFNLYKILLGKNIYIFTQKQLQDIEFMYGVDVSNIRVSPKSQYNQTYYAFIDPNLETYQNAYSYNNKLRVVYGVPNENVVNYGSMFYNDTNLQSVDCSSWNTVNVTDMSQMFSYCSNILKLDLSGWTLNDNVELTNMFYKCNSNLTVYVKASMLDKWKNGNTGLNSEQFTVKE